MLGTAPFGTKFAPSRDVLFAYVTALLIGVLLVCNVIAHAVSQSGLPRQDAWYQLLMLVLATALLAAAGRGFLLDLLRFARDKKFSQATLVAGAILATYAYSFFTLIPALHLSDIVFFDVTIVLTGLAILLSHLPARPTRVNPAPAPEPQKPVAHEHSLPKEEVKEKPVPSPIQVFAHHGAQINLKHHFAAPAQHPLKEAPVMREEVKEELAAETPSVPASYSVSDFVALDGRFSDGEVLWLGACLESHTHDAIGKAVVAAAHERDIILKHVENFTHHHDHKLTGNVEGRHVVVRKADHDDRYPVVHEFIGQGKTVIMVDQDGRTAGALALS